MPRMPKSACVDRPIGEIGAPIGPLVAATISYGGTLIDIIVQIAGVLSWTDRNQITYESMEPKLHSLPTCRKRRLAQT